MPEKTLPPVSFEPWFEGPEPDEHSFFINILALLISPFFFTCLLVIGTWLMFVRIEWVAIPYIWWPVKIMACFFGFFWVLVALISPYLLLRYYHLDRLSARLRGSLLGAFPNRAPLILFHVLFCAVLLVALALLVSYLLGLSDVLNAVRANLTSPRVLLNYLYTAVTEHGWLRLYGYFILYVLLFWLVSEVVFSLRFEVGSTKIEKVESFPEAKGRKTLTTIAHLTDLHVTATDATQRVDGGPGGGGELRRILKRFEPELCQVAGAVIITGDATDAGTAAEWKAFFEIVPEALLKKVVLVPGNHELNIPETKGLKAAVEPVNQIERKIRALRCISALDLVQGERAFVVGKANTAAPLRSLREYLAEKEEGLKQFIEISRKEKSERRGNKWDKVKEMPYAVWDEIFPMAVEVPDAGLHVVVLNSNDEGLDFMTNAYGLIGRGQIRRLKIMLKELAGKPFVVAMHHHLGVPPMGKSLKDQVFERAMPLIDGAALVRAMSDNACVVFNGHRHISYLARAGDKIQIISGPSTTLGDESGRRPHGEIGFGIYSLSWDARGGTKCLAERWCRLA